MGSPPLLTSNASPLSMIPPGSPSASGPPVLQTSLTAPPPQTSNSNSQPPLLQPMMQMPTSGSNTTSSYVNGGRPAVTMATSLSVTSASAYKPIDTKAPIRPNLTNNKTIPAAAPMEPISKVSNENLSQNSMKPAQDSYIQHVIDGHVIHESSQPFPIDEDAKGRNRKKSETKVVPPTVNLPAATTVSSVVNRPPPPLLSTPSTLSAPAPPPPTLPPPVQ